MATKLAARISRRLDAFISVKDIFDHPVPVRLASNIQLTQSGSYDITSGIQTDNNPPFQLLSLHNLQTFIQHEICPQLQCSHDTILDVYPATHMQRIFLLGPATGQRRNPTPFYIDFPPGSNCASLTRACTSLIEHFDIFRTVFLVAAGELYQVVLKHLDVDINVIQTEENVNSATRAFLDEYSQQQPRLGHPLIHITILEMQASVLRVILQMSHALYDGLSLEHIVRSLHVLYSGSSPPAPPKFARYMQHMVNSRKDGYEFWHSVLQNSSMTMIKSASSSAHQQEVAPVGNNHASKVINVPLQHNTDSSITQATIFTAACALTLSKEAGSSDVVFGRVVSGRQGLPITYQNVVGPCTNEVPVRVCIDKAATRKELLREIQDQYLNSLPFETLGFNELKKNCTDWPEATTTYGCCITYQNFDYHPVSQMEEHRVQIGILSRDYKPENDAPLHDLVIAGEAETGGNYLHVTVAANPHVYEKERVKCILEDVCERIHALNLPL